MKFKNRISVFLFFYSCEAQFLSQPKQLSAGAKFQSERLEFEDGLGSTPFVLDSGEAYRDQQTINAARNVGQFYILRREPEKPKVKQLTSFKTVTQPRPTLRVEFVHSDTRYSTKPVYQSDREIFDFTDSRFIRPFQENKVNYPTLDENVQNNLENIEIKPSTSGLNFIPQSNFGAITQFSSEPTNFQGESVILRSHTGKTDSILFDNYDTGVLPPLGPFSSNTLAAHQVPVFQDETIQPISNDVRSIELGPGPGIQAFVQL